VPALVAGMVAIPIFTGVIGVGQTWLLNYPKRLGVELVRAGRLGAAGEAAGWRVERLSGFNVVYLAPAALVVVNWISVLVWLPEAARPAHSPTIFCETPQAYYYYLFKRRKKE